MTTCRPPRRTIAAALIAAALLAGGCSSSNSQPNPTVEPRETTTQPLPTIPGDTTTSAATTTTVAVSTTSSSTTTTPTTSTAETTTLPETASLTTLIPHAALPLDPNDINNQRTITPEQQPIIDAYLAAIQADNVTASRWPLDPRSELLVASPASARALEQVQKGYSKRTAMNQVLDLSGGITYRPYVVETDDPNKVIVYDCQIDATVWRDHDTGAKAAADANFPNAGPPGVQWGAGAEMVKSDGRWLLDQGFSDPLACE